MKQILGAFRRTSFGTLAALFLLSIVAVALPSHEAKAASLLYRSLQLSSSAASTGGAPTGAGGFSANPGTAANGDKVSHTYTFQVQTAGEIQAIQFQYCNNPFGYLAFAPDTGGTCSVAGMSGFSGTLAPDAVVTFGNSLGSLGGAQTYTASSSAANVVLIQNTNAAQAIDVTAGQYVRVTFTATASRYFVNPNSSYQDGLTETPDQTNRTFFAHVETYAVPTDVNSAQPLDEGTVTSAVTKTIAINTRVQETLKFSVGSDTPVANDGTCAPLTGSGLLTMGDSNQALSASTAYDAHSYFRLATNSSTGAQVLYAGETLKSTANDVIAAAGTTPGDGTAVSSLPGTEQFGLALDSGDGAYAITDLTNIPTAYQNGATDTIAFKSTSNTIPEVLAYSDGVVGCDTGSVRYIANISNETPAGLYSTKVSYIAAPSY